MSLKIYFAVLEEIYNNLVPNWSAVLISCIHSITLLISFTKNRSNQRSISYCTCLTAYGPFAILRICGTVFNPERYNEKSLPLLAS